MHLRHRTGTDTVGGAGDEGVRLLCEEACGIGAGPLSEHNSAFDIRSVRDRIERDRVRGEAARLLRSLRPGAERGEGEAEPSANPGPAPPLLEGRRELAPPPRVG